jgi:hypothetical protein
VRLKERFIQPDALQALLFQERLPSLLFFEASLLHGLDWNDHIVRYLFNIFVFKEISTFIPLSDFKFYFHFDCCLDI